MMGSSQGNFLALDGGRRRIGVAIADYTARLPAPLTTITQDDQIEAVLDLIREQDALAVVVGLPRSLNGQDSSQTEQAKQFAAELKQKTDVPIYLQDEAVTSLQAEEELKKRGKPYKKEDIDALSATYILEDFLNQQAVHGKLEELA